MFCIRALRGRALPRVRVLERERGARARGRVALEAAQGRAALRAQVGQQAVGGVHLALHLGEVPEKQQKNRGPCCWLEDDEWLALDVWARVCVPVCESKRVVVVVVLRSVQRICKVRDK